MASRLIRTLLAVAVVAGSPAGAAATSAASPPPPLREAPPAANVTVTTIAGGAGGARCSVPGYHGGPASEALFNMPARLQVVADPASSGGERLWLNCLRNQREGERRFFDRHWVGLLWHGTYGGERRLLDDPGKLREGGKLFGDRTRGQHREAPAAPG